MAVRLAGSVLGRSRAIPAITATSATCSARIQPRRRSGQALGQRIGSGSGGSVLQPGVQRSVHLAHLHLHHRVAQARLQTVEVVAQLPGGRLSFLAQSAERIRRLSESVNNLTGSATTRPLHHGHADRQHVLHQGEP